MISREEATGNFFILKVLSDYLRGARSDVGPKRVSNKIANARSGSALVAAAQFLHSKSLKSTQMATPELPAKILHDLSGHLSIILEGIATRVLNPADALFQVEACRDGVC